MATAEDTMRQHSTLAQPAFPRGGGVGGGAGAGGAMVSSGVSNFATKLNAAGSGANARLAAGAAANSGVAGIGAAHPPPPSPRTPARASPAAQVRARFEYWARHRLVCVCSGAGGMPFGAAMGLAGFRGGAPMQPGAQVGQPGAANWMASLKQARFPKTVLASRPVLATTP